LLLGFLQKADLEVVQGRTGTGAKPMPSSHSQIEQRWRWVPFGEAGQAMCRGEAIPSILRLRTSRLFQPTININPAQLSPIDNFHAQPQRST
jgi:hypothetical protein